MALTAILFSILIGLLSYVLFKLHARLTHWQSRGIGCIKPHPILGNIVGFGTERSIADIWIYFYEKFKGTGPFVGFYWFQRPSVIILDPNLMKTILIKEFSKFPNRGFYSNPTDDPISGHLFLLEGQAWRSMRHKLSPTFTSGKMKVMFPIVISTGHTLVDAFAKTIDKESVVDVKDLMARFTTDVIGTCAFGIDCNSLHDPMTEFRVMGQRALTDQRHGILGIAFMFNYPNLARKLHMKVTKDDLQQFFFRIVQETIEVREKQNIRRNDFMDMLIDLMNNKSMASEDDGELRSLTLDELVAQAFVFFSAGFETSSTTMTFALYELAKHQDIQQRAREEVHSIIARDSGELTYEHIKDMKYLDQVISETLRLYTVLPVLNRCCIEDFVVPDNPKYVIKKGMPVIIPIGALHRDASYYPNPEKFDPDRFSDDQIERRDPILYMPFGDGPRNCVGFRFGQMQMRIGLALLLSKFKFSLCEQSKIEMNKTIYMLGTTSGVYLKCEKI